ncbi:hypothetical protein CTI12_AA412170 [Artemisia annua]|uniref:Uncharacterized protein n=1 Tax=Artemisia annua TaxID=35608 RepID=A0A2U1M744_ARTAN|nr:hypothetical protein CTI12_AA412170 [Artemisia annua]
MENIWEDVLSSRSISGGIMGWVWLFQDRISVRYAAFVMKMGWSHRLEEEASQERSEPFHDCRNGVEMQHTDVRLDPFRSITGGSNLGGRAGKRKISWQDPGELSLVFALAFVRNQAISVWQYTTVSICNGPNPYQRRNNTMMLQQSGQKVIANQMVKLNGPKASVFLHCSKKVGLFGGQTQKPVIVLNRISHTDVRFDPFRSITGTWFDRLSFGGRAGKRKISWQDPVDFYSISSCQVLNLKAISVWQYTSVSICNGPNPYQRRNNYDAPAGTKLGSGGTMNVEDWGQK